MDPTDDVIADLNAAFSRLESAINKTDDVETRRALRESLACLYELRVYREGTNTGKKAEKTAYHKRAESSHTGKQTEGIVWLRGKKTHYLTAELSPETKTLYPSGNTFTGPHTYPGTNLTWAASNSLPTDPQAGKREKDHRRLYECLVQGQPVLEGLHAARCFLANDPGPATTRPRSDAHRGVSAVGT